jgi:hypothetical protein
MVKMKIFYKPSARLRSTIDTSEEAQPMKKEVRTVVYDDQLRMEAYRFEGIVQPFLNYFHEYYVIGFVEKGERCLSCKNQEYAIQKGDIILFNPGDNHACVQSDDGTLDYRGINISQEVMLDLAEEVTGKRELPGFSRNVIQDEELSCYLRPLHELVMKGSCEFGKTNPRTNSHWPSSSSWVWLAARRHTS